MTDGPIHWIPDQYRIQSLLHTQGVIQIILIHDEVRNAGVHIFARLPLGTGPKVKEAPHGVEVTSFPAISIAGNTRAILGMPPDGTETRTPRFGDMEV